MRNSLRKLDNLLFPITHSQTFGNEELTLQNCKIFVLQKVTCMLQCVFAFRRLNVIWGLKSHKQKSRFSLYIVSDFEKPAD